MINKAIVLDANILIRAVLGKQVRELADDWPVLACSMVIGCPVWTEDADFFGTGVATWPSDRVELYFAE